MPAPPGQVPRPTTIGEPTAAAVARPLLGGLPPLLVMTRTVHGPAPATTAERPARPTTRAHAADEPDPPPTHTGAGDSGLGVPSWFTGRAGVPEPAPAEPAGTLPWMGADSSSDLFGAHPTPPPTLADQPQDDRPQRTSIPSSDPNDDQPLRLPPAASPWAPRRRAYRLGPPLPPSPQRAPTLVPPHTPADTETAANPATSDGWAADAASPVHAAQSLLDFARPARNGAAASPIIDQPVADEAADSPPAGPGQQPASDGAQQAPDPDEMASQLYDRIRGRLRAELLIDRERAALLSDRN